MADVVRELAAKLGLDFQAAEFLKAETAFEAIHLAAETLFHAVERVADALSEAVVGTAEQAEALEHLQARTGLSTTAIQEWQYVGQRSGITSEEMALSLGHLGQAISQAQHGSAEASAAFAKLGVSTRDASGRTKDADALMGELAEKLGRMPAGFERTALSMQLFGRAGGRLLPVFAKGREEIDGLRKNAHELGNVMDEEMVARAAELNGVFEQLRSLSGGLAHDFAGPFLEPIKELGEAFLDWYKANRLVIRSGIEKFAKVLLDVLLGVGKAVSLVVRYFDVLLIALASVGLAIFLQNIGLQVMTAAYIHAGLAAVAAGVEAAAAWVAAAAPVVLLATLLALVGLAAEDVYRFLTGSDSLIGDLGPKWTKFLDEFTRFQAEDPWWLQIIRAGVKGLTDLQWALEQFKNAWALFDSSLSLGGPLGAIQSAARAILPGFGQQDVSVSNSPVTGLSVSPSLPSLSAGAGRPAVTNHVEVPINVQVGPGTNPHDVARAVGEVVDERIRAHLQDAAAATE